ncbi:substrate-binding and VWA domain-containing protein [Phytoactinopolyspora halotolerans]|uniref:VWA domain-containing protein n=1 Tax=Phytoactinopolyspora halotolerans TaxID=1981512 RepID=A0A6L9SE77_9ACTN|nr:substrate-binding and VWA domain-containing protein [Phytoactinopolyspora halotolerans]NEE02812.1 VWA domain-containing protein [Phytoactinopolyspora halotolerans]
MSGRHAQRARRRRRSPVWPIGVAVVLLGLIAAGGYLVYDVVLADDEQQAAQGQADGQAQSECDDGRAVSIVAAPGIATVLEELAHQYNEAAGDDSDGLCASVTAASPAEAAEMLGGENSPDMWVPDSSAWIQRAAGRDVTLGEPQPLALSPLVLVASQGVAREQLGWPDNAEFSWSDFVSSDAAVTIVDPMSSTEGLSTLLAVQAVVNQTGAEQAEVAQAMSAVARSAVADVDEAYAQVVSEPSAAPLFHASEQSVVEHNRQNPDQPAVALYPAEGTVAFDYPAVPVHAAETASSTTEAVQELIEAFRSDAATSTLQEAGFRSPQGEALESAGVVDGIRRSMPETMPAPEPQAAEAVLRQWAALSIDMRMLPVIDVSGSMWEDDGAEQLPIEVVRDANLAALDLFPPTSELGLWVFSTEEDPPDHWREVVEIGPLSEEVGDGTRLDALVQATNALPDSDVRGWTALYDTAWAAYQEVKDNYDPNRVNSVVLLTDGEDERPPEMAPGMDLETLLAQLRAQHDSARPVLLITIGIGPDADMDALQQISEATGASAYQVQDPADLEEVFFRAMVERQCRPDC